MSVASGSTTSQQDAKQQIIASLFNRRGQDGMLDETYIAHLKIWEDVPEGQPKPVAGDVEEGGRKARYLMLAVTRQGKVQLHKAKRNTNMTFSKGKTWALQDLRVVQVNGPQEFALTMTSRTYIWTTEKPRDQSQFLNTLLKVYNKYTQGKSPQLVNFQFEDQQVMSPETRYDDGSSLQPPVMPVMRMRQHSSSSLASSNGSTGNPGSYYASPPNMDPRYQRSADHLPMERQGSNEFGHPGPYNRPPVPPVAIEARGFNPPSGGGSRRPSLGEGSMSANGSYRQPTYGEGQGPTTSGQPPSVSDNYRIPTSSSERSLGTPRQTGTPRKHSGSSDMGRDFPQPGRSPVPLGYDMGDQGFGNGYGGRGPSPNAGAPSSSIPLPRQVDAMSRTYSQEEAPPSAPRGRPEAYQPEERTPAPPAEPTFQIDSPESTTSYSNGRSVEATSKAVKPVQPDRQAEKRQLLNPIITTTQPSPQSSPLPRSQSKEPEELSIGKNKRAVMRRASFQAPAQTTPYSRDLLLRSGSISQPDAGLLDDDEAEEDLEDETMANVEEMLEGFDFGMDTNGQQPGTAEAIEARLLDEISALDAANIHAFLEADDRIAVVMKGLEEALTELDEMDSQLTGYKLQLGVVSEDITFIESQNKGLQVQTTNQKALLAELEQLIQIVQVDPQQLQSLAQASLENERGIETLEASAASLYQALQAGRDMDSRDITATVGRMQEYESHNRQFCLRVIEYLLIMFKFQAEMTLANSVKSGEVNSGILPPHSTLEENLGKYCGIIIYIKEMDEERYQKLCANYFTTASDLHGKEIKSCLLSYISKVKRPAEDDKYDGSFTSAASGSAKLGAMQRSRALLRGQDGKKDRKTAAEMKASEAFDYAMQQVSAQIFREDAFIADFLQITEPPMTYADYMDLDSYFKRQATRNVAKGMSPATVKLRRSALDLIFAFLTGEIKDWIDGALQREPIQIFGMLAACERLVQDAEARNAKFFLGIMQKQVQRVQLMLERYIADQVKVIEATKLSLKKRVSGPVFYIRHFPAFAEQIEAQLADCDGLVIREMTNTAYERIVSVMFDTLQQMAKLDRSDLTGGEDKGQLNYFIIMIENMQHYVAELSKQDLPPLNDFLDRAQEIYEENLTAYVKAVLRRSFAKPMDFFDGVDRLLQTTPANEIASNPTYNKSSLKKAVKDVVTIRDLRKAVEALSKRVEKHFAFDDPDGQGVNSAESAQLISTVWSACEKGLARDVERWQRIAAQCYGDAGQGVEYLPAEVIGVFKKARAA